jgi:hypothetical protein
VKDQGRWFHPLSTLQLRFVRFWLEFLWERLVDGWMDGRNIPVLSEKIMETEPSDLTECNFLTIAFLFAICKTPKARVTVVTIGRPSGIAATANETREKDMYISDKNSTKIKTYHQ